jgi:hypothetical protein
MGAPSVAATVEQIADSILNPSILELMTIVKRAPRRLFLSEGRSGTPIDERV